MMAVASSPKNLPGCFSTSRADAFSAMSENLESLLPSERASVRQVQLVDWAGFTPEV